MIGFHITPLAFVEVCARNDCSLYHYATKEEAQKSLILLLDFERAKSQEEFELTEGFSESRQCYYLEKSFWTPLDERVIFTVEDSFPYKGAVLINREEFFLDLHEATSLKEAGSLGLLRLREFENEFQPEEAVISIYRELLKSRDSELTCSHFYLEDRSFEGSWKSFEGETIWGYPFRLRASDTYALAELEALPRSLFFERNLSHRYFADKRELAAFAARAYGSFSPET